MSNIIFIYNQIEITIQCKLEDKLKDIFLKFTTKIGKNKSDIYFLYEGSQILNDEITLNELIHNKDKTNSNSIVIKILVNDIINSENNIDENECLKPSKQIICPKCKENIRILIHDYKIKLYDCKNHHMIDEIPFNDFEETQMINEKKIICEKCKNKSKNDTYENQFYRCLNCKINLCPLCKNIHDKTHNIVDYELRNSICEIHYEPFSSYCKNCLKDICLSCDNEHEAHETIYFGKIMPNIKEINDEINEQKVKIKQFINDIEEIKNKLNDLINNIEIYYKIYNDIIQNYNVKNRNFLILQNIKDMQKINNDFYNQINMIVNEKNIVNKFGSLMNLYDKMNIKIDSEVNSNINENNFKKKEEDNLEHKNINEKKQEKTEIKEDAELKNKEINKPKNDENKIENTEKSQNDENVKNELEIKIEQNESNKEEANDNSQFDISKIKKIGSIEFSSNQFTFLIKMIYKLKDERIAFIIVCNNHESILSIIDLKTNNVDINVNLNLGDVTNLIQMDDGNLVILNCYILNSKVSYLKVIKINEKKIETIQSLEFTDYNIRCSEMYKLSKDAIIFTKDKKISFYDYKNGKISEPEICQKCIDGKIYNSKKNHEIKELSGAYGIKYFIISNSEMAIYYEKDGFLVGFKNYVLFYDIDRYKKIEIIDLDNKDNIFYERFNLIDKNNLLIGCCKKILLIDLKTHKIKDKFNLQKNEELLRLLIPFNKDIFMTFTEGYYLSQYQIKNDKIEFKNKIKYDSLYYMTKKINENKLILSNSFDDFCEKKKKILICG